MNEKQERIRELIAQLNEAAEAYYKEDREIMPNYEYDRLYDELSVLEQETGLIFANSPTQNVGFESADELVKEAHATPMLSLDKTKDPDALASFLGDRKGILSWKLDGLTIVLTYENGSLFKAVTRGNGEIGEVVTANALQFENVPRSISYKGNLVIRGEAVIRYKDFEKINEEITDLSAKYKNPRNLCSGSVRQLDPGITAKRHVRLYVFSLESADGNMEEVPFDIQNSNEQCFLWLKSLGFDVVPYKVVTGRTVSDAVQEYAQEIIDFEIPSDGLVLLMDDIPYGRSLGRTAKYPRNAIAFKWKDEIAQTTLLEVEWSPSRTGLINPIAVFEPVELEGTTVSRASLHNLSIIEGLKLGIGDTVTVYKANMIIPQIAENLTQKNDLEFAKTCPACGADTVIHDENGVKTLLCPNPDCPAKKIKTFADFVSRNAMNIEGISEETLEKFIGHGFISEFADIYKLDQHKDQITSMMGFGEKSYENIIKSVDASRKTTCARVLNALGIIGIGQANAKLISKYFKNDFESIRNASFDELITIDQIGEVLAQSITGFFSNEKNKKIVDDLLAEIEFEEEAVTGEEKLSGMTFVITGTLNHYENRDALKAEIERAGGKVSGSVSSKTSFLINNDILSNSSKNKTAKSLGIPIITEEEYMEKFR
ncbi:MAG: NAD-dependent DNA ligase LigA [Lachnospiraceae bacterium]|nr:NAD-dependent DNA ligase LigA [Lachnospiraceae bacterium]